MRALGRGPRGGRRCRPDSSFGACPAPASGSLSARCPGVAIARPGRLPRRRLSPARLGSTQGGRQGGTAKEEARYPRPGTARVHRCRRLTQSGAPLLHAWRWGNLPCPCITPARFTSEREPSQSAGALGPGPAARAPTQRAARLTETPRLKVIGSKGIRPAPIAAAAGPPGGGVGRPEDLKGAAGVAAEAAENGARPGERVRRSFRARAGDQPRRPLGPVPEPGTMKQESAAQNTPPPSPSPSAQPPEGDSDPQALWIFGYGSLVWRPDFAYSDSRVGFVRGYSRRFWQGDTFHRGSDKMPGRVVTLLEDHEGCTWGVAYQVCGEQVADALKYLNVREAVLGGYDTKEVTFYPQDAPDQPLKALAYVATPQNPGYLGPAPEEAIATQILACRGFSGHNLEYLLRLADFMQLCGPQAQDEHLEAIVDAVGTMLPCFCPTEQALALV
ncbi:glutathione-specific gamma-glutamylcyclotransferase 1 [Ochotona princeps]|uniref:glutathione-specific gamma-glutamylcyclotransferase 1 n=1 Tax=Ochotona princeps TaxID=9978 RepID=UPI0027148E89|nr:glutathione-specific gamma-glutamylcyclotransferase 1 [Ochotona princeps]